MSGFVGLLALDGRGVDPLLLQRLTDGLTYFAADGASARATGRVGLGFAESRLTRLPAGAPAPPASMPAADDQGTWVVADAALDDLARLVRELGAAGIRAAADAPGARLLLAAYRAWGTRCVEHLHGDFAFALWDAPRGRLFLARDRFGARPLYYAHTLGTFVFSNALDVVRAHPAVSSALDEAGAGDFLRLGYNTDLETTVFAGIRCVPPAHCLIVTDADVSLARYWELPRGRPLAYRRVEEYAEHFMDVFSDAVSDRLRGLDHAVLLMSGGRDSTAVAATACGLDRETMPRLGAVTAVFDYALPDEERTYASIAGAALDIPIEFVVQDEYGWFEGWERDDLWRPEPVDAALLAAESDLAARAAAHGRVALTGDGGDAALRERESHLARLLAGGHWGRALAESLTYIRWHHRLPRPGFRRWRGRQRGLASPYSPVPPWMRPELIERAGLRERWAALEAAEQLPPDPDTRRPEAYSKLRSGFWPRCSETDHASATGIPLELRHPFFDERVVEFLLSLPAAQWANDKGILVAAMRGRLPDRVRLRGKTPLAGDAYAQAFSASGKARPGREAFSERALEFVDPDRLFAVTPEMDQDDAWDWVRAYSFSLWLRRLEAGRTRPRVVSAPTAVEIES